MATMGISSSIFIILGMTFDRYIAVCNPLHAAIFCTARRAKITVAVIMSLMFLHSVIHGIYEGLVTTKLCVIFHIKTTFSVAYSWFGFCLGSVFPYTVIIIMNTSIIKVVKQRQQLVFKEQESKMDSVANKTVMKQPKTASPV